MLLEKLGCPSPHRGCSSSRASFSHHWKCQGFSDFNSLIIPSVSDTTYYAFQKYPPPRLVCL